MKLHKLIIIGFGLICLVIATACEISDSNIDPDRTNQADINNLLPAAQLNLAFGIGGDISQFNSIFMQQIAGVDRVHGQVERYNLSRGNAGRAWNDNFYPGAMMDLNTIITEADDQGSPYYAGISRILMATALGTLTSNWGDVPYSEAFDGVSRPNPVFDSSEDIYTAIQDLLTEAINNLEEAQSVLIPGNDDLVYGGNLEGWIMTANVLKARYANHQSKVDPTGTANDVLDILENEVVFSSIDDDAYIAFPDQIDEGNPWFRYKQSTFGDDTRMSATLVDLLVESDDPRISHYVAEDGDGNYTGAVPGSQNSGVSDLGPLYGEPEGWFNYATYAEMQFLKAEAHWRLNQFGDAAEAYNEGVQASVLRVTGSEDGDFFAEYADADADDMSGEGGLEQIMTQKYIALFLEPEIFSDWRRTGYPELTLPQDAVFNEIVRRWPYPQSELNTNEENLRAAEDSQGGASMVDRIWWDTQ